LFVKKGLIFFACWCLFAPLGVLADDFLVPSAIPGNGIPQVPVVIAENKQAIVAYEPRKEAVQTLVNRGICQLSGKTNLTEAWKTYVSTQDIIGIKVLSAPGANSGTRPAVVEAVIRGLLESGIPGQNIIIWDKRQSDLRNAGFVELAKQLNVRTAGSADAGYDENVFYDNSILGTLVWGDLEFGRKDTKSGRKSYFSKLLTSQITKIINIAPLLNHNVAGINGCLCSLSMGSVDNTMRFELQSDRMSRAVPEIYAQAPVVDHTVLNIMDALISQYQGEQVSLLHYAVPLGQIWFSKDPVALDSLGIEELERERQTAGVPQVKPNLELYQNATLMDLGACDARKIKVTTLK
jgi:uncharacterized protein (DUF362 family)